MREMLDSVMNQTYENWELCLADGSDNAHGYVEGIVREYQKKSEKIRYQKLEKNEGISGNTNHWQPENILVCLTMTTFFIPVRYMSM